MLKIKSPLCVEDSGTSPYFSHVTLHSFRAPLAFSMFEYRMPRTTSTKAACSPFSLTTELGLCNLSFKNWYLSF